MQIREARKQDCLAIAELAQMAGDGIPGYFWAGSQQPGQTLEQAGATLAGSETANFSYRNAWLACINNEVGGMLLAYRLPSREQNDENPNDFPEFVRPLVELEQCVPESFYINMLAAYPRFRGQGIGTALMDLVDGLALNAGCSLISIEVFANNVGALKLYQRLGYEITERRALIESDYHQAGEVFLLTRKPLTNPELPGV